jgi:hypothetical protein
MYPYIPKLHHAMITALFCVVFIALCGKAQGSVLLACKIGALFFAIMTAVILAMLVLEELNRRVDAMTSWMIAFSHLDDEGRAAVAFTFPTMRYRMRKGVVREMFEDTSVTIEQFRLFLKTSNDRYISPRRDWVNADMPQAAWEEIKLWLEEHDYIIQDSAAGSHSWLWKGQAYQHLMAYWMSGRTLMNMGAQFAQEEM